MKHWLVEMSTLGAFSLVVALGAIALGGTTARQAALAPTLPLTTMPGCSDAPVFPVDGSGITGEAKLCITDEAVRPAVGAAIGSPDTVYMTLIQYVEPQPAC